MMRFRAVLRYHLDARLARPPVLGRVRILVDHQLFDGVRGKMEVAHFLAVHHDRRLPGRGREKPRKKFDNAVGPDRHRDTAENVVVNRDGVGVLLDVFPLRQRAFSLRDFDPLGDVDPELQLQRFWSIGADGEAALERLETG